MQRSRHPVYPQPPNPAPRSGSTGVLCFLAVLTAVVGHLSAAPAPKKATPRPAAAPAIPQIQFAKSLFVNTPGNGRDPFFPNSSRRGVVKTNIVEGPMMYSFLTLKGISGSKNRRLAI